MDASARTGASFVSSESTSRDSQSATLRVLSAALPTLGFVAAVALFYTEILLPVRILADYDTWTYFYPLRAYGARALLEGRFPLWNPDTWMGAPFFANPQTALLYPGSALFYLLPTPYAYSLTLLAHALLGALLMYAFLSGAFEVGRIPAFIGASAFAFGGFMSSEVGHINQFSATALLPGIALAADRALQRQSVRWVVAGGGLLATQLLAGHAQESYMTLWVVGAVLLRRLFETVANHRAGRQVALEHIVPPLVGVVVVAGCIGVIGFGLAAVQLIPTAELTGEGIRAGGMSFAEGTSFSLPPPLLARSLLPGYWYNVPSGEYIGYIGAIALGFGFIALAAGRKGPVICAVLLATLGLFLAVGAANPIYPSLFDHVPGLRLFRVPARWLFVYSFGASALAALGADWLLDAARRPAARVRVVAVAILVAALFVFTVPTAQDVPGRIVLLWILGFCAAGGLGFLARRRPGPAVGVLMAVALLLELRGAASDLALRHAVPSFAAEERLPPTAMRPLPGALVSNKEGRLLSVARTEYELEDRAAIDRRFPGLDQPTQFDFDSALKLDEVMTPNVPLRYGLGTADGYDGGVLPLHRFLDFASLLASASEIRSDGVLRTRLITLPETRLLDLMGVTRVIANHVTDKDLDAIHYDVATARELRDGRAVRVAVQPGIRATAIGILGSLRGATEASTGRMTASYSDGSQQVVELHPGAELFDEHTPGPVNATEPTAGLSREGLSDSALRLPLTGDAPLTELTWQWSGPGQWNLRAATLLVGGTQQPLILEPGMRRTQFGIIELFERDPAPASIALIPNGEIRDDHATLDALALASDEQLRATVWLAPETVVGPAPASTSSADGAFSVAVGSTPEHLVFQRTGGSAGGYLMVPDAWFPGWTARIDGQPTVVYRADVLFKAVFVPPEARTVEMTYEPTS
ncbi:MAG: hypothetical protein QOF51_3173, partial [Chloroflexota bacterium]|nr:hypothetical protein [Chloroflexota bacterium]